MILKERKQTFRKSHSQGLRGIDVEIVNQQGNDYIVCRSKAGQVLGLSDEVALELKKCVVLAPDTKEVKWAQRQRANVRISALAGKKRIQSKQVVTKTSGNEAEVYNKMYRQEMLATFNAIRTMGEFLTKV